MVKMGHFVEKRRKSFYNKTDIFNETHGSPGQFGMMVKNGGVSMEHTKQDRVLEIFFRGLRGEDLHVQELADEYDSTQVQFVGIPTDVYNQENMDYALSLIRETGADYTHLMLSEELYNWGLTEVQYVPTTFFVNSEGEILDTVVGSKSKSDWKILIDSKLASE